MTNEPSMLPWHLEGKCIYTAHGDFIGEMEHTDDARIVVDAVNWYSDWGALSSELERLHAERDRLRDIINRLIVVRENVFWRKDEKTGLNLECRMIDEEFARKAVADAKAAIAGEESK